MTRNAWVSILGLLVVGCSSACGGSSTQAATASPTPTPAVVPSPTPDAATQKYVALIHSYWIQVQAADEVSNGANVAAEVCLGKVSAVAPNNLQLIDPSKCRARMVESLAAHQRFLIALNTTSAPYVFAADDQAFRSQIPKVIVDLKALISIAAAGNKNAVLQGATTYVDDMIPLVTNALDDVDPAVVHD